MKSIQKQILVLILGGLFCIPMQAQTGFASYYSDMFQGRKTASGELYNKDAMTAAHRTLPFGTILRVTRLDNNMSVIVKVNDRGPYAKDRIVDISKKAALGLDLVNAGVAKVKIEKVDKSMYLDGAQPTTSVSTVPKAYDSMASKGESASSSSNSVYTIPNSFGVQVGSFSNYNNALNQMKALKNSAISNAMINLVQQSNGTTLYKIVLGPFADRASANAYKSSIKNNHKMAGFIVDLNGKSFLAL